MTQSTLNRQLETALADAHERATGLRRGIRLPSRYRFTGSLENLRLQLPENAAVKNMQEDEAAFEGWLLALKAWLGLGNVEIAWPAPSARSDGHHQRFLYRVMRFNELFPWFCVAGDARPLLDASLIARSRDDKSALMLNTPSRAAEVAPAGAEARLERRLAESPWLKTTFGLDEVGRQMPVGVFDGRVANDRRIFAGGSAAIDLVGVERGRRRLWAFELKAVGNAKVGMVSELFFYCCVLLDLRRGLFRLPDEPGDAMEGRLPASALEGFEEIGACFLAPAFHPLLDDEKIVGALNQARWPSDTVVAFSQMVLPTELLSEAASRIEP